MYWGWNENLIKGLQLTRKCFRNDSVCVWVLWFHMYVGAACLILLKMASLMLRFPFTCHLIYIWSLLAISLLDKCVLNPSSFRYKSRVWSDWCPLPNILKAQYLFILFKSCFGDENVTSFIYLLTLDKCNNIFFLLSFTTYGILGCSLLNLLLERTLDYGMTWQVTYGYLCIEIMIFYLWKS